MNAASACHGGGARTPESRILEQVLSRIQPQPVRLGTVTALRRMQHALSVTPTRHCRSRSAAPGVEGTGRSSKGADFRG